MISKSLEFSYYDRENYKNDEFNSKDIFYILILSLGVAND